MPGRDITRRLNKSYGILFPLLFLLCFWLGQSLSGCAQDTPAQQAPTPQETVKPADTAKPTESAPQEAAKAADTAPATTQSPDSQTPNNPPLDSEPDKSQGVWVYRKDVQEVMLHATVVDDRQRIVTSLDKGAFTVFEDGKPQSIISFHHVDIPVAMGIVIDNSGSMREKRNKVNQAALNLVRSSNPKDEVFIVNFNDEQYLDQDFTHDLLKLKEALEKIDARGGTALYDAVVASADHLKKNARLEKKVIFVVTDGEDNASSQTLEQAVKELSEEGGPSVYAIGVLGDEEHPKRAKKALQVITDRTGGIAFFPKTLDEVDEISKTIANDIRNQYAIGYKPIAPKKAGEFRQIRVEAKAKGHGKMIVRTKSGYYAGSETASSSAGK